MYENLVLYVNSVVLAVFHIFAFIIFLIMDKCISCTQETGISSMGGKLCCVMQSFVHMLIYKKFYGLFYDGIDIRKVNGVEWQDDR